MQNTVIARFFGGGASNLSSLIRGLLCIRHCGGLRTCHAELDKGNRRSVASLVTLSPSAKPLGVSGSSNGDDNAIPDRVRNDENKHPLPQGAREKPAFTLAEVLITLSIIGVVAAMTLPGLIQNYKERELTVLWKKFYSDFSNAALLMSRNQEDLSTELKLAEAFTKYIKHIKVCDTKKAIEQGCWKENTRVRYYDGSVHRTTNPGDMGGGASCMVLINGGVFCFDSGGTYVVTFVDVNGTKKPNIIGRDIFFAIFNKELYQVRPAKGYCQDWGAADGYWVGLTEGDGTCTGDSYGYGCSAEKLLQ